MLTKLEEFEKLVSLGLKITPLIPGTKVPMLPKWTEWDYRKAKSAIESISDVNLGIVLGDVMDVEGDSEKANAKISKLIGDYKHPVYYSQKSFHHLFQSPDPSITIVKKQSIEFRGARHQSVIPPSKLLSGTKYEWITDLNCPIPPMPPRLLQYFNSIIAEKIIVQKPDSILVNCFECNKKFYINKKRFALESEILRQIDKRWMCNSCRDYDLRGWCRKLRRHTQLV